jgi:DNA-directed RNA polymerase specialized sigma24 family protein
MLRSLAGQISLAEIAERLGRTKEAVRSRARTLKISLICYGERHPGAKYSDQMVEFARRMYEEGLKPRAIARVLDMPVGSVKDYVYYRGRLGHVPERW